MVRTIARAYCFPSLFLNNFKPFGALYGSHMGLKFVKKWFEYYLYTLILLPLYIMLNHHFINFTYLGVILGPFVLVLDGKTGLESPHID